MKIFFSFLIVLSIATSCGLKYTPQATLEYTQEQRRNLIEKTLTDDFAKMGKKYASIGYANSVKIKPASYHRLDSLFEIKYHMERNGRSAAYLDEAIKIQQIRCQNDTNEIVYLEKHVFTLEGKEAEILAGDFYINKDNQLKDVKFTESYQISKDYINFYTLYAFEQSFLGNDYITEDEQNFYRLYKSELQNRGIQKNDFLEHSLKLMQIASYKRTIDTQTLLKELTRKIVHKDKSNYSDEVFVKIEQEKDGEQITKYIVVYQSMSKTTEGFFTKKHQLEFDSFLFPIGNFELAI